MLRLMNCITAAVEESTERHKESSSVRRISSFALIPGPKDSDFTDVNKPLSRKIIEKLPYPTPLPVWQVGRHKLFRMLMDVAFGSFGYGFSSTAKIKQIRLRKIAASYVAVAVAPFLAVQPNLASSIAAQTRSRPCIELAQAGAWLTAENRLSQAIIKFLMVPWAVKWRQVEIVKGHRVHLFCREPPGDKSSNPRPLVYFVTGGGFIANLLANDFEMIGRIAALHDIKDGSPIVVSPEYPLAPAHPYPEALNCVEAVYRWARRQFSVSRCLFVAESAGGNFALALTLRLLMNPVDEPLVPDGLVVGYPTLHLVPTHSPSRVCNGSDPLLATAVLRMAVDNYVPAHHNASEDHCLSPAVADRDLLSRLPPVRLQAAGLDPLLDDTIDFASRLRSCKVPNELLVYRCLPHGFWSLGFVLPDAAIAVKEAVGWVHDLLSRKPGIQVTESGAWKVQQGAMADF